MSIIKDIKANSCQLSLFPDKILPLMTTEGRGCGRNGGGQAIPNSCAF